jgi:hypothetical protein
MVDPTLKDVLDAIARLEKAQGETRVELRTGFARVDKRFDDLDDELTLHAKVHRKIEDDITALKGRPPRTAARRARRPGAR